MNMKILHFITLALSFKWSGATGAFSFATAELESLIETYGYVIEKIEQYLNELENSYFKLAIFWIFNEPLDFQLLRRYLNVFQKEHIKMKDKTNYVGNPINALQLIHSLTADLQNIERYLAIEKPEKLRFPNKEDADRAAIGIWRLQKMYNLDVTQLAAGKIRGTYSHGNELYEEETSPMSVGAVLAVGRGIFEVHEYKTALEWMHEALNKYNLRDSEEPYMYIERDGIITDYICDAYNGTHDFENAIKWTNKLIEVQPARSNELNNYIDHYYKELAKNNTAPYVPVNILTVDTSSITNTENCAYQRLCRGEVPVPEHKRRDLHCYYKFGPSPFLRLAPIKTEVLHLDPEVFLFYDTISDDEIKHLRKLSTNKLKRGYDSNDVPSSLVHILRVCKLVWLFDSESSVVARISRRVADFTDLSMVTAEALQMANYGIGGHYAPHYDFQMENSSFARKYGNRISTVMFYMSNVEQGGATVFLNMQLTVFPVKNSAIFWYNMLPSGQPDFRSRHAGCPVLRGSKWVSNKWIHEFRQELTHPCGLENQNNSHLVPNPKLFF